MSQKRTACSRCGEPHILDGGRCVRCRQRSDRELELHDAMVALSRFMTWAWMEAGCYAGDARVSVRLIMRREVQLVRAVQLGYLRLEWP